MDRAQRSASGEQVMSGAPERKYTDRDVRENPTFVDMVEEYLDRYTGDFEFLIDNKMRVARGMDLTTPQVRGVLNCMRHDPRITNLPEPLPYEDNVVEMVHRGRRARQRHFESEHCLVTDPHYAHEWAGDHGIYFKCPGIPWAITRQMFTLPATVRRPFVCARTGAYVHKVKLGGNHFFRWYPKQHEWGWLLDPVLSVATDCKYPYRIDKPLLFSCDAGDQLVNRANCPHCGGTE